MSARRLATVQKPRVLPRKQVDLVGPSQDAKGWTRWDLML